MGRPRKFTSGKRGPNYKRKNPDRMPSTSRNVKIPEHEIANFRLSLEMLDGRELAHAAWVCLDMHGPLGERAKALKARHSKAFENIGKFAQIPTKLPGTKPVAQQERAEAIDAIKDYFVAMMQEGLIDRNYFNHYFPTPRKPTFQGYDVYGNKFG